MTVYLLWLHDNVLGIFHTRFGAMIEARKQRRLLGGTWARSRARRGNNTLGIRWWSEGPPHVSRLEIEPRKVQ